MPDKLFDEEFLARLEQLEVLARKRNVFMYGSGRRGMPRGGEVEFSEHKPYTAGDDLRYIDWNVYGRLERYVVKLFAAEEKKKTLVLFDTSNSMQLGNKFKLSLQLAAALGVIGLFSGDTVELQPFSDIPGEAFRPAAGTGAAAAVLDFLAAVTRGGRSAHLPALGRIMSCQHEPARVILISDLWSEDDPQQYLEPLADSRWEVSVLHVLTSGELSPPALGRCRISEMESDEVLLADVSGRLHREYLQAVEAYCERIEHVCRSSGMEYLLLFDSISAEEAVFGPLLEQGVVR